METENRIRLAYIIDDDEIIIYLTEKMIETSNVCDSLETFRDGLQAINRLKVVIENNETLPDVILLDLNMPVMDGWEFVEEYMHLPLPSKVPLFVFTSSINPADKSRSLSYPVIKGFIPKPLTMQKLDKIVRIIC